ncbi:TrkH family potassium uptake protein [Oceanibacterium hippocampi]|uniref:Trk system potassium uptake protein n=1 Tax=Oceanibacterium hippocampi TaxID=745714 RepID=A0A1Y5R7T0_9PROT|nr:TrkH family potassium uptake protein [Oceanibacterium hippocampi]SLN10494.1 Trk system potassium uptake protein TrkH [Oceanibacterium hippocampi]
MASLTPVVRVLGMLLIALAVTMLVPLGIDMFYERQDWTAFLLSATVAAFAGGAAVAATGSGSAFEIDTRQAFLITGASWLILPAFAAGPFLGIGHSYTDSFFETVSGLTTTGSTVLVGLDDLPKGILLWRSFLQWLGGIGIIVMAIVLLPFMRVGGMQLFRLESSDKSEKAVARSFHFVFSILLIYLGLTILCAVAYAVLGMSGFDAVNHAMATLSTGGYSTHDASFSYFVSPALHWTSIVFMLSGALPFVVYIRVLQGKRQAIWQDPQVRFLLVMLAFVCVTMALWLTATNGVPIGRSLRLVTFNVVSVVTTTGFASADYSSWGPPAATAFFLLTFVGGCAGSTSGAIKIYRIRIALSVVRMQALKLITPSRIVPLTYGGRRLSDDAAYSVLAFLFVYLASTAAVAVLLSFMDLDLVTALTASATAISNVGPGLGPVIGPAGNFATLPDGAKWVLTAAMLLGRLEIFTLFVLINPRFWEN